ncbi:glutamate-gated chloride channel-like isoform X2 [Atheta coriaria]|uniref:glutamate-gated chloride channel-like isoform X2 n=1 Tax=Dalotia coriaria TaxID=877792 RepID=UPI0031F35B31
MYTLSWWGHMNRMNDQAQAKRVWMARPNRSRKLGRPRKEWDSLRALLLPTWYSSDLHTASTIDTPEVSRVKCNINNKNIGSTYSKRQANGTKSVMGYTLWLAATMLILQICYSSENKLVACFRCEEKSNHACLGDLLKSGQYDKRSIPSVNGTLTVNIEITSLTLSQISRDSLNYEVDLILQQRWHDPRLGYNLIDEKNDYLNATNHYGDIWLPDTNFVSDDSEESSPHDNLELTISPNGTVNYLMGQHLNLSCPDIINTFPIGDPICSFKMKNRSYNRTAIEYVWKYGKNIAITSSSFTALNTHLIDTQTMTCPMNINRRENYRCLQINLKVARDINYYISIFFLPNIILVNISFITFWIHRNAVHARVIIGAITSMALFAISNGFICTLPLARNLTEIKTWNGVCMYFICGSLLEFVLVHYLGQKELQSDNASAIVENVDRIMPNGKPAN